MRRLGSQITLIWLSSGALTINQNLAMINLNFNVCRNPNRYKETLDTLLAYVVKLFNTLSRILEPFYIRSFPERGN